MVRKRTSGSGRKVVNAGEASLKTSPSPCAKKCQHKITCEFFHNIERIDIISGTSGDCENIHNLFEEDHSEKFHNISEVRLNKFIASAGICSRRKADLLVSEGKVRVNGLVVQEPGLKVKVTDPIEVDGKRISVPTALTYLVMYKPIQIVCTSHDPQGRKTVLDILPPEFQGERLFPIGRLDYFSEGLLLLTNDGDFANRLMHPRYNKEKIYEVLIRGKVQCEALKDMRDGMILPDEPERPLLPVKVRAELDPSGNTLLTMTLKQGINRQIRRMAAKWNLVILSLKRVAIGQVRLGQLRPGEIRKMTNNEVEMLCANP